MLLTTRKYKSFIAAFKVLPRVKAFLDLQKINLEKIITEPHFFEVNLFDILDKNGDGIPDEEFGKNFDIVYYGIIERWNEKTPEGFTEEFKHDEHKVLANGWILARSEKVNGVIGIRYKVIIGSAT